MNIMRLARHSSFVLLVSTSGSFAWDQTYPSGPVRSNVPPALGLFTAKAPLAGDEDITKSATGITNAPFQKRTVSYPSAEGADLGTAWDFLVNEKGLASCIDFVAREDSKYQTAEMSLKQTIDEETLNVSLNVTLSGSVGGTIELIKGKAEATSKLNASHHMASSDTYFVVHGSVSSGVKYVAPGTGGAVILNRDMASLAASDPVAFRARCGDGFVGSIGLGADLYLLLHAHDLTTEDKLELEFDSKASAGMGDIFNASGSSNFKTKIDKLVVEKKLDINFVQNGGVIETLPTTLDAARIKVASLSKEEFAGPRSTFVTVIPYSTLANWPSFYMINSTDIRQKAIRYGQRLSSIKYEILNVRENYYRVRNTPPFASEVSDAYFFNYYHNMREENLNVIANTVDKELTTTILFLSALNEKKCNSKPVAANIPAGLGRDNRVAARRARSKQLVQFVADSKECQDIIGAFVVASNNFDDMRFSIQLPVPLNTLTKSDIEKIRNVALTFDERKTVYAQDLYRHWVERVDQARCRLFSECLSPDDKKKSYDAILATIAAPTPVAAANLVETLIEACSGEHNVDLFRAPNGCLPGKVRFGCDGLSPDAHAVALCERSRGSFAHTATRSNVRGGNQCGYQDEHITCFNFVPTFP